MDDDQDGGWVSVSSGTGSPGWSRTEGRKTVVVVVVVVKSINNGPYAWSRQYVQLSPVCTAM